MFLRHYYAAHYFAPRYFPGEATDTPDAGPYVVVAWQTFSAGAAASDFYSAGAAASALKPE